jgi:PAS domain S-box-containing protein
MEKEGEPAIKLTAKSPQNKNLSSFRLFLFTLLAITAICSCGYLTFYAQEQKTQQIIEQGLESMVANETAQISAWRNNQMQDAATWMGSQEYQDELSKFTVSPDNTALRDRLRTEFAQQARISSYKDILFLDSGSNTVLSLNDSAELSSDTLKSQVFMIAQTRTAGWIDFFLSEADKTARLAVVIPLLMNPDGPVIGSVVYIIDPSIELYPLLQAWPASSKTAEVSLVEKSGEQVSLINNPRFLKDETLNLKFDLSPTGNLFTAVAKGVEGISSGQDYRGVKVLAALKHIPESTWYLVGKIDRSEVFSLWNLQGALLSSMVSAILSIIVVLLALFWRNRQKAIEIAITRTELDHQAVVHHIEYFIKYANDSVLLFDNKNHLVQVNDRFYDDFHYQRDEVFGSPLERFVGTDHLIEFQTRLKDILQNGPFTMEVMPRRKDGSNFPAEITARVFKIDEKTFLQTIIRDITELKVQVTEYEKLNNSLEERVQERTTQLENANRELESFAYSISHDLRAPLNSINGWSKALSEDYPDKLGEKGLQFLNRIRSEAQRLGQMVDDLLKFSRETRGELKWEDINLTKLVQTVTGRLQIANPNRKMQLVIQPDMNIRCDPKLLEMALTNLIDNALKFTSKQPLAVILIGEILKDNKRVFFVRDNGAGFDMAYAEKLFKVFQRLHKVSDFPGTGVGLATVQRIINRHGGQIWAESQIDQGTTFYFTLKEEQAFKVDIIPSNHQKDTEDTQVKVESNV